MIGLPVEIKNIEQLEDMLSTPSIGVLNSISKMKGDIMILGSGGKIGPSLARMAIRASEETGANKQVTGISLFSSDEERDKLKKYGINAIHGDLIDQTFLSQLPEVENIIFMAGMKFGSTENIALTWAINSYLPGLIADRFRSSKIVVYSTGCVYPFVSPESGGAKEDTQPIAVGEYAQSSLGRERMFEYGSNKYKTPVTIVRLNYAVEMRYGVLYDIAIKVKNNEPIDLSMAYANVIWQGDANSVVLQAFDIAASPAKILNLTGPEIFSLRQVAEQFGELFNTKPLFEGQESDTAWINNASQSHKLFGLPSVALDQIIIWVAKWIENELPSLNKPTHYEVRDGKY